MDSKNVFDYFDSNLDRLATKQQESQESTHYWLFRYLTLRLHFILFMIYGGFFLKYKLIICETNSALKDSKIHELICLFNYTYVVQNQFDATVFGGMQSINGQFMPQTYYPHVFLILFLQYVINLITNIVYYQAENYKKACLLGHRHVHKKNYLKCAARSVRMLSNCRRTVLIGYYFLIDSVILVGIYLEIVLVDFAFDWSFIEYGFNLVSYHLLNHRSQQTQPDPIRTMFPIFTKCSTQFYGSSGNIQEYDNLCVLFFNYINQFVFTFYWFWYAMLIVLFSLAFIYKTVLLLIPKLRPFALPKCCLPDCYSSGYPNPKITFRKFVVTFYISDYVKNKKFISALITEDWSEFECLSGKSSDLSTSSTTPATLPESPSWQISMADLIDNNLNDNHHYHHHHHNHNHNNQQQHHNQHFGSNAALVGNLTHRTSNDILGDGICDEEGLIVKPNQNISCNSNNSKSAKLN